MKIIARQCPWTGQLFTEKQYANHLRALRKEFQRKRDFARKEAAFKEFYAHVHDMATIDEINQWLDEHFSEYARRFLELQNYRYNEPQKKRKNATFKFTFLDMKWKDRCSTMHSAPRGQKTTGWNDPHIPEPGWWGSIKIDMTGGGFSIFHRDLLVPLGIHTGTGGGCEERLNYEVTLFAKDFRIMSRPQVLEKLKA